MPTRLFISHSWSYSDRYNAMVNLLNNRPYFNFTNFSVPETKAFGPMARYKMEDELRGLCCTNRLRVEVPLPPDRLIPRLQ